MDLSQVKVPVKQAKAILMDCRNRLVENMMNGICRKDAHTEVAEWLEGQDNILSPYAHDAVFALIVTDDEIEFRKQYGNAMAEAVVLVRNAMAKMKS